MSVLAGVDRLLAGEGAARSMRYALLTNHSACTAAYTPSRQALLAAGLRIVKLFAPEHGLLALGADGEAMADGVDALTGLTVKSLYGEALEPSEAELADVDAVLVDLPDVGCRCYTYLWSLSHMMEACCRWGKRLIVLDRPNPISGRMDLAEGPLLDEQHCASFIGRWPIPLRHSCTLGELARLWRAERLPALALDVVELEGWRRTMFHDEWSSSFVPTSPAMTNAEACLLYPGLCLLEATNLSEGRGTPLAFRLAGAPWLAAQVVSERFNRSGVRGVAARAVAFLPESGKYRGQGCQGVMLHVTERERFHPVAAAVSLIHLIQETQPEHFAWAAYPTHVNPTGERHLEKLLGVNDAAALFAQDERRFNVSMARLLDCSGWPARVQPHLLYE